MMMLLPRVPIVVPFTLILLLSIIMLLPVVAVTSVGFSLGGGGGGFLVVGDFTKLIEKTPVVGE